MAATMIFEAPPPSTRAPVRSTCGRFVAVFAIVLSIFAVSTTPVVDVVPEPVSAAVSSVVPDTIEEFFAVGDASAGWFSSVVAGVGLAIAVVGLATCTGIVLCGIAVVGYAGASYGWLSASGYY